MAGNRPDDVQKSSLPGTVTHDFEVTVKYVRREIRDLTDRDRETFFNAVSVLQRVPSAVGREIYGGKYYSKDYFNRLHLHYGMCLEGVYVCWLLSRARGFRFSCRRG